MLDLLQRELVVIAGKGGVGRTTITAGLGLLAARAQRPTAMIELNGMGGLSRLFDLGASTYGGLNVRPGLDAFNISAQEATEEYLLRHLRFRSLYDLVFGNRFIAPFMDAVLGLSDLVALGKVMDLGWEVDEDGNPQYELLLLDSPATGHGLTMLRSPRAMMDMARKGPLFNNAKLVDELLSDPARAALVLVTLPEEMPVNETLELAQALTDSGEIHLAAVVINGVPLTPFDPQEGEVYRRFLDGDGARIGGEAGRALREVERMIARRRTAQTAIDHLRASLDVPMVEVPMLPTKEMGLAQLREIAAHLETLP
jgi:anion-transporting  ArsA/GET3 family ATPase